MNSTNKLKRKAFANQSTVTKISEHCCFSQAFSSPEVNSLALSNGDTGSQLYSGCGDNNIYSWDIETGQETVRNLDFLFKQ